MKKLSLTLTFALCVVFLAGHAVADIVAEPPDYDFGDVPLHDSATATITITNIGVTEPFLIYDIYLQSGSSPDFEITVNPQGVSLQPDESVDIEITFTPSAVGYVSAVLVIDTSDTFNPYVNVPLGGTGAQIKAKPEEYDFGDVVLGLSEAVIVTISNVGSYPLNIDYLDIRLGTGSSGDFAITVYPSTGLLILNPDEWADIEITFTPSAEGYVTAVLEIDSLDLLYPFIGVPLSGTGVVREEVMTLYVDADADSSGDGASWGTAYKYLQDALHKLLISGDQIWVADGTYKPDEDEGDNVTANDRTETFQLVNGVAIYGGFAGGESSLDERNWRTNETILSGDIGTEGVNTDNGYHVVTGSGTDATAILDGFTITAGNASGSWPSPTALGSGMYNYGGSPTVTNCTFSKNSAESGGGMWNNSSSPTVTNCTFSGNSIISNGGGMFNWSLSNPTVTNCTFSRNSASSGSGMFNNVSSSPTITNCTFIGNSAGTLGGGMTNFSGSSPTVTNCTFIENTAGDKGGGMYNESSSPMVTNCILWGDSAPSGPEIFNIINSTPSITYSDVAGGYGGTGNIDKDPVFIDSNGLDGIPGTADDEDDNVHLRAYSPCINAGDPSGNYSGQVDVDNQPRVAYGRVDMGADEVFPIAGDFEPDGDVDLADFAIFANHWLSGVE